MAEDSIPQPLPACEPDSGKPDADAVVRLGVSSDRMKLGVACYTPARGGGQPLTADMICRAARHAGVTAPLDSAAVARVADILLAGQDARDVVIARGVKPAPARDARVEPLLELSRPVFPGMAFGRLHPARDPATGRDLAGNEVPSPDPRTPRNIILPPGAGCALAPDGALTATCYGLVQVGEAEIRVEPLIAVAPDRLTVAGVLYGYDAAGAEVTVSRIEAELARLGITAGVDVGLIMAALEVGWDTRRPVPDVTLARGRPPRHGQDARLEPLYAEQTAVGTADSQDRMDYRDRGYTPVADAGQDIARLHPATAGEPGADVFGEAVPARPGKPLAIKAGKNVEALEDGLLFRALVSGVVLAGRGLVEVSDLLVIPGDVDLSTGNIRVQKGSVQVKGTVRTGFAVEAPDGLVVDGTVEDATLVAGGDVFVRGGIVMSGEGEAVVRAGGDVTAGFTQSAQIRAGGDVTVLRYISRSNVQAGFRVRAGGVVRVTDAKGRIMGGTVICGQGLEVCDAGSDLGVETVLVLTQENEEARALIKEKRDLKALVEQVEKVLAGLTPEKAARLTPENKAKVKEMIERRENSLARLKDIRQRLAALAQEAMDHLDAARIIVRGVAHPGVVVKMGGKSLYLDAPVHFSQFAWDRDAKDIKILSL